MLDFDEYAQRFENIELNRDDAGVITVRLHTKGGSLVYGERAHVELSWVFRCVADDPANRVVILTGTGDTFWALINPPSFEHYQQTPEGWDRTLFEERRTMEGFLSIDVPIISAINGPALVHSHLPLMADIVLASETACFSDSMHAPNGIVPGDGAHIVWPLLLGANRGRYFLLMGETIDADRALELGVISEVLAPDALLPRAREIAAELASKPTLMLRQTRSVLRNNLEHLMVRDFTRGMSHEAIAGLASISRYLKDASVSPRPESDHFVLDPRTGESRPLK
jgi:enoyl-CoA hydratase/carnithine racemase